MKKALWFLFSLKGRVSRVPFIVFAIVYYLTIFIATYWADTYMDASSFPLSRAWAFMVPGFIGAMFIWPMFATCVKRLHDIDRQSFWAWIILIKPVLAAIITYFAADIHFNRDAQPAELDRLVNWPNLISYYVLLLQLVLALWPGTKGANRYGPSSKEKTVPIEATFE
ncbi:DUF805 domain-containing protein [Asticcacaulis tiandongensis]|uniref:DUF805 domain-containing protein n=1 Tax=Asticcacaulis tiandongensis TaxID=2565365 RepID=UPI0015E87516|nr:DUF805 domain-containing protein [Asticcacaulis tiandongensis]